MVSDTGKAELIGDINVVLILVLMEYGLWPIAQAVEAVKHIQS